MIQALGIQLFRFADDLTQCINSGQGECQTNLPKVSAGGVQAKIVTQLAFMVIGVIAVVVIMLAGFKLMTSQGDPQALAKARQTIVYAAVGLVVAISAELIVGFLINRV